MSQIIPKYAQQILGELNIIKSTLDGVQDNVTKLKRGQVKIKSTLGKVENNVEEITQLFEDDIYHNTNVSLA